MQIRPCFFLSVGFTFSFLTLSSCEKASPYLDKLAAALNRKTPSEEAPLKAIPINPADIPPPPALVKMEPEINKEARVAVLAYHDFTDGKSNNDMILNIDDFRDEMQAIKDSELPVISMQQFLDWKQAKKDIPAESVLITIDDGWKATYTLAIEVLREFGYPFTVFLYENYIGVGGHSLTPDQIREIVAAGGTISSHSVSHQDMARRGGKSRTAYEAWLKVELEDSWNYLEDTFGDTGAVLKTFAYPYGIYSDQVAQMAKQFGYQVCFTVNGKKTTWETPDMEIGRYVVHGTTLANFEPALNFGKGNQTTSGRKLMSESRDQDGNKRAPLVVVYPSKDSLVPDRLPRIRVDLSKLEGVQPDSISLRITSLGRVPHVYNPATGIVSYQIPQKLRLETCSVQLSFRHAGNQKTEIIAWNFKIDKLAEYLSANAASPTGKKPVSAVEQ